MIRTWHYLLPILSLIYIVPVSRAADAFDHQYSRWQTVLDQYTQEGLVHYGEITGSGMDTFQAVADDLESVSQEEYGTWDHEQKKAFWINAYNIGAIKLVLEHYPLRRTFGLQALRYPGNSIQQIPDVWDRHALSAAGQDVSLNDIEHQILRKEFEDPRIHFAIVCASRSCAELKPEAYTAEKLDQQLNDQVRHFIRNPDKFRYDAEDQMLFLSPIFKWFREDFGDAGGIIGFLNRYIRENGDRELSSNARIQWLDYDWSLNEP